MKNMLKHENPNIEIINKYLWAVRFSLIPFIPQISYKPDPSVPLEQVPGQFGPDGIMILNKDFKHFELVKKATEAVMKLKNRQIKKELDSLHHFPQNQPLQVIYRYCLLAELERRKVVKNHGNN